VAAALAEEHTAARGLIVETDHPRYGTVRNLASPVRAGTEPPAYRRAPQRGEDLAHVTAEVLGFTEERVAELAAAGAFGPEHAR
jgi:crotonobetainyl-CoA:carnitine CoA-transferase CaiB-like acyl-CoA transferase